MVRKWNLDYMYEHGFVLDKIANRVTLQQAQGILV